VREEKRGEHRKGLTDGGEEDEEEEQRLAIRVGDESKGEAVEDCVCV